MGCALKNCQITSLALNSRDVLPITDSGRYCKPPGQVCPPPITATISFLSASGFLGFIRSSLSGGFGGNYTTWRSRPNSSKGKLQLSLVCVKLSRLEKGDLRPQVIASSTLVSGFHSIMLRVGSTLPKVEDLEPKLGSHIIESITNES